MTQEFHREDRYIVIKHKDLGNVPVAYREHLVRPLFALQAHLPIRECIVVESDWPEYEPVWRMIEARVTGKPQAAASPEVLAVVAQTETAFPETQVVQRDGIDAAPVGTELIDRAHYTRLQAEVSALQLRLNIADQRVCDLQSELTKALSLVRWFYTHANVYQVGTVMMAAAKAFIARQSAPAAKLDPVDGDVLPPVGSKVWIELASSGWDEQTVTGYYVWPSRGLDKNVHRVFVRVKDSEGTPNARLLADVRTSAQATPQ